MRHPTDQQWTELLYDELPTAERTAIQQHLKSCSLCHEKWSGYRSTLEQLDSWKVEFPPKPRLVPEWSPMIKWAAAAALLVTTAFATGRLSKPSLDADQLQARLSKPLEERIDRELNARLDREVRLATERALEATRQRLQTEFTSRIEAFSQKALADAAAEKEQLRLALATLAEQDKTLYAALHEIESKRQEDYRGLREDLEKVALFTDQSLRSAQRQIVQLSSFNQPLNNQ